MKRFDENPPARRILKLYEDLSRQSCSIITQLRPGHIGLNQFLHRIGVAQSPLCEHCNVPETVDHFLLTCKSFTRQRETLRWQLFEAQSHLNLQNLLADHYNNRILVAYVHSTGRLNRYHETIEVGEKHKEKRKR
jgi:hypothetical protein